MAVTIDEQMLHEVDGWVARGEFPNRSKAVQAGLERLRKDRDRRTSLLAELAKLDPEEERELAEEWLASEAQWPEY